MISDEDVQHYLHTIGPLLVVAVHQRDKGKVADLIGDLGRDELLALAVALAELNPDPRNRLDDGVVDMIAVQRAMDGHLVPLTRREKSVVAHKMRARGDTIVEIGRTLGVTDKTVRVLWAMPLPQDGDESLELDEVAA